MVVTYENEDLCRNRGLLIYCSRFSFLIQKAKAFGLPNPAAVEVELAGLSWNITMLMQGGEFYAVVNCYTHRSWTEMLKDPIRVLCTAFFKELCGPILYRPKNPQKTDYPTVLQPGRTLCNLITIWQRWWNRPVPIFDVSLGHWVSKSGFDLPSNLDWAGHSEIEPTNRVPVCLLTVEQLRSFSGYKRTNVILDLAEAASQIRVDTGRGSSFHRLPSLAAVVLNLISLVASRLLICVYGHVIVLRFENRSDMLLLSVSWCFLIFSWFKVLLKFPTILTILFATTCLGSLSNIYKRAQQEVPLSCLLFNIQISREKFSVCLNDVLFNSSLFDTVNSSWSRQKKNIHRLPDLRCFNSNCTTGTPFAFGHHGTNAGGSWWTRPEVSTFRHSGRVWKLWRSPPCGRCLQGKTEGKAAERSAESRTIAAGAWGHCCESLRLKKGSLAIRTKNLFVIC